MLKYYLKRLSLFFFTYMLMEFIERIVRLFVDYKNMDTSFAAIVKVFAIGFIINSIEFFYFSIFISIYLLCLPQRLHNTRLDKWITGFVFGFFVYISIFEEVAEHYFYMEFTSRFNFIAVDYLVYTREVIGNIYQSYPLIPILLGILVVAVSLTWLLEKYLTASSPAPTVGKRWIALGITIMFCVASYVAFDMSYTRISVNQYDNEIATDGIYGLFYAFKNNELSYEQFYLKSTNEKNAKILHEELARHEVTFCTKNGFDIARKIAPSSSEIRANMIIVIMESMGAEFLDENWQGKENIAELTPNLSKLSQEGLFLSNVYVTGSRTVRGLEAVVLSIPPLPGMSIVRREGNENLHSLGTIFKEKGYNNKFIYGGRGYFDNMNYFFENNGFNIVDRTSMDKAEITFANIWGVCDENLFAKVIREADDSFASAQPFLHVVMTTSNHRPFTYPEGKIEIPGKTGRIGGVKYADFAIGEFIKCAKTKPWFDNTIFMFIADHGAGSAGQMELNIENHHIPVIIYAPKLVKPRRINTAISQIDAVPTLLGLVNFKYTSRFYGEDVLQKNYKSRFFISNYQKVGYVENKRMVVLKPLKDLTLYDGKNVITDIKTYQPLIDRAVAYYQHASLWREHLK